MFPILNINFTVKYSQGSVRSLCHSFSNDVLLVPSSLSSTVLRRGSRISWNFCTVVSVWPRHLSHKILIPYPFPWLFRVFQCFLPFNAAMEVCCQLFSRPDLWPDVFVQYSANSFHFSSRFNSFTRGYFGCNSHGMLYLAVLCGFLTWRFESFVSGMSWIIQFLCFVDLVFFWVLKSHTRWASVFFFSNLSVVFSTLLYLSSHFLFYWVFHSSKLHRHLLLFHLFIDCCFISRSVANLHLIVSPFCLWVYLLRQNGFLRFFQIMYIFLV